jgi:hypothetical protein
MIGGRRLDMRILSGVWRTIARIPRRLLGAVGWVHTMEPMGLGAGRPHIGDLDEIEAERRLRREVLRQDEEGPN